MFRVFWFNDEKQCSFLCQGQRHSLKGYELPHLKKFEGGPANIFVERYQYNFQFHRVIFPITSILSLNMQTEKEQHRLHCRTYDILYFLHCIIMGLVGQASCNWAKIFYYGNNKRIACLPNHKDRYIFHFPYGINSINARATIII